MPTVLAYWRLPLEVKERLFSLQPDGVTLVDAEDVSPELAQRVSAIITRPNAAGITKEVMERFPALRHIQTTGAGRNGIDVAAAEDLGIRVESVQMEGALSVAVYTLTVGAYLWRGLGSMQHTLLHEGWAKSRSEVFAKPWHDTEGATWGVVGLGVIGRATAQVVQQAGFNVVGYDVVAGDVPGVLRTSWSELWQLADVISLHVPLLPSTTNLVNQQVLSRWRGGVLINAARGGVVDELAVASALQQGILKGFASDVYTQEPVVKTSPLLALAHEFPGRVILTPHIAGVTPESVTNRLGWVWQHVLQSVAS